MAAAMFEEDEPSEGEREDLFLDTGERKTTMSRESRKERESKLKQMMEDDGKLAWQYTSIFASIWRLNSYRRRDA
jgi:hypothetical protein